MYFRLSFFRLLLTVLSFMVVSLVYGLDGSRDVFVTAPTGVDNGWKTFEIISGGDDLSTITVGNDFSQDWVGNYSKWDGLGAYRHDDETLRIFVNHEAGSDSSFTRIDLNVANLKAWIVAGIPNNSNSNQEPPPSSPVVEVVSRGWLDLGSGADPLDSPCTGNVWFADTFGSGRGFANSLYMLGEETFDTTGHIWVMDLATRLLYEATDLGGGSWENATVLDTRHTDTVAIMLSEDNDALGVGTAPLVLYVGQKDPASADFLARNGLVGGNLYYWHADSSGTNGTMTGIFSAGNGTTVSGSWQSDKDGAVLFSKSEDLHVNMDKDSAGYGVQVAVASQDVAIFLVDCSTLEFVTGDLESGVRDTSIRVLYQASTQASTNDFKCMDNVVWSPDGKLYVNEDDGEGDIWSIDVVSLLASYGGGATSPSDTQVYEVLDADFAEESSGITDISEALDYVPGSIFLTTGLSDTLSGNQIALCVSPDAQLKSEVYPDWLGGFPALNTAAKRQPTADPDYDGMDNATEFALGLSPDTPDAQVPLSLEFQADSVLAGFTAARSLDLVDYYLDYTEDLAAGFTQTILIRAADVGPSGQVSISLPHTDQLFARVRAILHLI